MAETIEIGGKTFLKHGNAEHSVIGKNRFYHHCDFKDQRVCYGVCAGIIDAHIEEREWTKDPTLSEESCTTAIKRKQCAGLAKRQLERKVDACLFYVPRQEVEGELVKRDNREYGSGYQLGWNKVSTTPSKPEAKPAPVNSTQQSTTTLSYADAINEALSA
jgi:hypothetical protein